MSAIEFQPFPKIARLSRDIVITEKLDGTNAQVFVTDEGEVLAGSRTRWVTPTDDNYGFAAWVKWHGEELRQLGPGAHFGEWWGKGIQRGYGLSERRFSLFNVRKWGKGPFALPPPSCCDVVPILYVGPFDTEAVGRALGALQAGGSIAAPGFMRPEGVVIYHAASGQLFKKTLEKDEQPKGVQP
jgi:hypothetical protein